MCSCSLPGEWGADKWFSLRGAKTSDNVKEGWWFKCIHWVVLFLDRKWPCPGEMWPGHWGGGQQLVTIILQVLLHPHLGSSKKKKGASVSWSSRLGRVSQEEKTPVGRVFISPSVPFAWHGKTARHSSHRRSGSGLRLPLSGSLCHSRVADSGPFGSQTWVGCLEEVQGWWVWLRNPAVVILKPHNHTLFQKTWPSPVNFLLFSLHIRLRGPFCLEAH